MMTKASAQSLAVWLLNEHPSLFYNIAKQVNPSLGAFSDILENISGAFSSAVSGVGNWISNSDNVKALTGLAGTYFATQASKSNANAQLAVLQTQAQRAQAGQTVAPITYTYDANNQPVPVYIGNTPLPALGSQVALPSGQIGYTMSPTALATLQPSFLQKYGLWLGAGALALLVTAVVMR